jgi:hypothetical protein
MYATGEENKFLEVTYAKGEREIFYFKDFSSGAMIENIVARAKKKAVKRIIDYGERGVKVSDLIEAVQEEFKENEDLPNTTNPDADLGPQGRAHHQRAHAHDQHHPRRARDREHHLGAVPVGAGGSPTRAETRWQYPR